MTDLEKFLNKCEEDKGKGCCAACERLSKLLEMVREFTDGRYLSNKTMQELNRIARGEECRSV